MTAETETPQSTGSCCTPTGSCHDGAADVQIEETGQTGQTGQTGTVTTVYQVKGMTCGHCEGSISEEVSGIAGVTSVAAVAATGLVTVTSKAPLAEDAVRAAVDEAGYELLGQAA
ncbi:heavy-metal-associated domain-containing protein [Streptomyces anulatus]